MKLSLSRTFLLSLLFAWGASHAATDDELCAQLKQFAEAVPPGETATVVLRGGGGGDNPNLLVTHDCRHFGKPAGKAFCHYLLPHTSWEFGIHNAERAAQCLGPRTEDNMLRKLEDEEKIAEVSTTLSTPAGDHTEVTLRFDPHALKGISALTITVSRPPQQ